MDKNSATRPSPPSANALNQSEEGNCLPATSRQNMAQLFMRRAGAFFSRIPELIAEKIRGWVQSVRQAWSHVEQALLGRDSATALTNVREVRSFPAVEFDVDEESSEEEVSPQRPDLPVKTEAEPIQKEEVTPDFFGLGDSLTSADRDDVLPVSDRGSANDHDKEDTGEPLSVAASVPERHEISPEEKLFNEFSERYDPEAGYVSIDPDDAAFDLACLKFARQFQEAHPEASRIIYTKDTQQKRRAATALLFADAEKKARADEKKRMEQEREDKLAEQRRRDALSPGQADFEDFSAAYQAALKNGRAYLFADGSKYFDSACLSYARQRLTQQPEETERDAIAALLSAAPKPVTQAVETDDHVTAKAPAAPPPAPSPRWKSALQSLLGTSQSMPKMYSDLLMPHHSPDDKDMAWEGLRLLLWPQKSRPASATVTGNEETLNYPSSAASANEDQIKRLELAKRLLEEIMEFNEEMYLRRRDVFQQTDDQKKNIVARIRTIKSVREILLADLQLRIEQLLPKKITATRNYPTTSIPNLSDLSSEAIRTASNDFEKFVQDFSEENIRSGSYEFTADRRKYLRPNCVAIAQLAVDTYRNLSELTDVDQKRQLAALFLVNQYSISKAG